MEPIIPMSRYVLYTGSNVADVLSMLNVGASSSEQWAVTATNGTMRTIQKGFSEQYDIVPGNYIVRQANGGFAGIMTQTEFEFRYTTLPMLQELMMPYATSAMGIGAVPSLLLNASTNVAVTIKPTLPSTDYSAAAITLSSLNVLSALQVQSITKTSGSVVTVNVKNTGLVTLSGQVIVTAVMNS